MVINGHGHLDHHRSGFSAVQPFLLQKRCFLVSHLIFLIIFYDICFICISTQTNWTNITQGIVSEFAKIAGVPISTSWNPSVTHVIASTDPSGACKRTLKFLMAILNGKWVVSIDCKSTRLPQGRLVELLPFVTKCWLDFIGVKASMEHTRPVDEVRFEVATDVHGTREGPRLGRQRVINKVRLCSSATYSRLRTFF
jgi:hypothetical protein